jgi:hypothetical protein
VVFWSGDACARQAWAPAPPFPRLRLPRVSGCGSTSDAVGLARPAADALGPQSLDPRYSAPHRGAFGNGSSRAHAACYLVTCLCAAARVCSSSFACAQLKAAGQHVS